MGTNCPKCESDNIEEFFCDDAMAQKVGLNVGEYGACHECHHVFRKCEVWSRVCGFLRPTDSWNKGKKSEWNLRKNYKLDEVPK